MTDIAHGTEEHRQEPPAHPAASASSFWARLSGLHAKLILPYAVLTLFTAVVGIYVVTRLVAASVRERFVNQLTATAQIAADTVARRERTHLSDLRLMAFTVGVPEALTSGDAAALQRLLVPLMINNKIEALAALDARGQTLVDLRFEPQTSQIESLPPTDYSQYRLVQAILLAGGDSAGDKFAAVLNTAHGPYLFSSAPVRPSSGDLAGLLLVGTRLSSLLADIDAQALADALVLDRQGRLLATTLPQPDEGYGLLELDQTTVMQLSTSLTHDVRLYGREYQILYAPLVVRQQPMGVLGIVLQSNYVVSAEATSRNTFSLIFTLATAAVILIGSLLAQSIAGPILRLRSMTQAVAAGDLNQSSGLRRGDEIGELANAFDTMTLRLRERTAEAARLYAETVEQNRELAETNARLRATQQQLIQSEKLAAIGHLTAGIVHDVKNPLAVIRGLAETLAEDTQDSDLRKHLTTMRDSAAKANRIVSDLLTFARQSETQIRERDLKVTVETALRLTAYLAREARVRMVADLPERSVVAQFDGQQIEQVLVNLIQNAIQAMPTGGTLRLSLAQASNVWAIGVQDSGVGIPPENLNRIFDPFFTTKPEGEGTGLGLSVSYGIVAQHGGRIEVESKVGEGTTFTILLPVRPPGAEGA